jgi:uncharacterized protein (TIGR00288 family)
MRAPHVGAQPSERPPHNAALLIDFDNVTMGIRSNLGAELRKLLESQLIKGKVAVQRAYADWRRYPQYIVSLSEASIDLIFAPAYGSSRKNATDIRLAIDALELVFTRPEIGTFILLSGDSDFSSLVLKLKEYGKYVIGVGLQESTSDILVQNCDEYYSYNTLGGLTSAADMPTERLDPWELVVHAIERMVKRKDVMRSDRLKQVMLEIDPSFDEKTAGFTKFNRFLSEAAHRDLIRLRKGESGQYEVAAGQGVARPAAEGPLEGAPTESASEPEPAPEPAPEPKARGGETPGADVPAVALSRAYEELSTVVVDLFDGSDPVRDSMVKRRLLERNSAFDEGALGFNKFSRFLKQAHDEGIVTLEQRDDGNFYLTPAKAGKESSRGGRGGGRGGRDRGGRSRGRTGSEPRVESTKGQDAASEPGAATEPGDDHKAGAGSPFATAKEVARRTLGRFRGGSHAPALSASPDGPDAGETTSRPSVDDKRSTGSERTVSQPEESTVQRTERSGKRAADRSGRPPQGERSPKPRADRSRKPPGERSQKPQGERSRKPQGERSQKPQGERSRKPQGERSRKPRDERSRAPHPGPSPQPSAEAAPEPSSPPSREMGRPSPEPTAKQPVEQRPERRGMGRYRRGSVGRSAPVAGTSGPIGPAPSESTKAASTDSALDDKTPGESTQTTSKEPSERSSAKPSVRASGSVGDPIEHMIRNYTGVGRRTAEALVDRFGTEVFQVIDRQPERLKEVISAARARAVIAARESERTNGGA